jgi:gluconolactonase
MAPDSPAPTASLADPTTLAQVATGMTWAEGPAWIAGRQVLRFSDVRTNRVLEFHDPSAELRVLSTDPEFTNGRTIAPDGSVVECSHGRRAIQVDAHAQHPDAPYAPRVLADHFGTARLNSPNDVVVHPDGSIWFTDPSYGIKRPDEGHGGEEEYGDRYVFRFDPAADDEPVPVVIDVEAPNGLAFSPDTRTLYVADTSVSPAAPGGEDPQRPGRHVIHAYDVFSGRHAKNGRILAEVSPGAPDGIRVDREGRIWTSSASGVQVLDADGTVLEQIPVPEPVANLEFGGADGRSLFICATSSLYRIRTRTQDARAWMQP